MDRRRFLLTSLVGGIHRHKSRAQSKRYAIVDENTLPGSVGGSEHVLRRVP